MCRVSTKRHLTPFGIGLHSILPRELADGQITLLVSSMIFPELRYNVRRGRVEAAQVYQFDHVGQTPNETTVVRINNP